MTSAGPRRAGALWTRTPARSSTTRKAGGYKTARNAYRAHAYKKRSKSRRRKAASVERRVKRLMDANPGLHDEILADMVIAAKEGVEYTAEDLVRRLEGIDLHGLTAARILSNL